MLFAYVGSINKLKISNVVLFLSVIFKVASMVLVVQSTLGNTENTRAAKGRLVTAKMCHNNLVSA